MRALLTKIDRALEYLNESILIIAGIAITLLILAGAALRYIFAFNFKGSEEIILMIGFWLYFIGSISAAREKSHLHADMVTLFTRNEKVIAAAALVKDVLSLLICALAIQWCYEYWCWTFPLRPTTSVYKLPLFVSQIPMCLSFVLWAVFLIRDCCTSFLLIKNSLADQKGTEEVVK